MIKTLNSDEMNQALFLAIGFDSSNELFPRRKLADWAITHSDSSASIKELADVEDFPTYVFRSEHLITSVHCELLASRSQRPSNTSGSKSITRDPNATRNTRWDEIAGIKALKVKCKNNL